jgi:hypothetical protein
MAAVAGEGCGVVGRAAGGSGTATLASAEAGGEGRAGGEGVLAGAASRPAPSATASRLGGWLVGLVLPAGWEVVMSVRMSKRTWRWTWAPTLVGAAVGGAAMVGVATVGAAG